MLSMVKASDFTCFMKRHLLVLIHEDSNSDSTNRMIASQNCLIRVDSMPSLDGS